ncbi:MAG: DUF1559 domain-containing protein [Isosphaeraceae bacterium]
MTFASHSSTSRSKIRPGSPPGATPEWNGSTQVGPLYNWVVSILQYLDSNPVANAINQERVYTDDTFNNNGVSNRRFFQNHIRLLTCPEDDTILPGKGNLSYVVNGGFSRWPGATTWNEAEGRFEGVFPPGLHGSANGVAASYGTPMDWGTPMARRTGVMFLSTAQGNTPWDVQTTAASITDGASTTVLLTENVHAGYAKAGNPYSGGAEINWAAPLANSVMFFGSDNICGGPGHAFPGNGQCLADQGLAPVKTAYGIVSGPSWGDANRPGTFESINGALRGENVPEGGSPYPSSRHAGGISAVFCDGSTQFISDTIDGAVWARLITPSGSQDPPDVEPGPDLERFRLAPIKSLNDVEFYKFQPGSSRPASTKPTTPILVLILIVGISIPLGIIRLLIHRRGRQGPPPPSLYDRWLDG